MPLIKKIISSIQKRYFNILRNGYSVEKRYGCKWLIDWSNNIDKKLTAKSFEHREINYLLANIEKIKPEYFFDIGAHSGLYSIIIKKSFPNIKVISFEPDKQNRFQLFSNLFLNQLQDEIEVYQEGLSNVKKEMFFGMRKNAPGKRGY